MAANSGMSLRQLAKELGVSHSLLVLWRQGKRRLAPKLEARYHQLVTSVTTGRDKAGQFVSGEARFRIKSPVEPCPGLSISVCRIHYGLLLVPSMSAKWRYCVAVWLSKWLSKSTAGPDIRQGESY